jgi:3-dehydroquinate dehydratase-2
MTQRVFVLSGPNVNQLGRGGMAEGGPTTLAQVERRCAELARELDFDLFFGQSNQEGQLIDWVHQAQDQHASVIINPAGLAFRSEPLLEALRMVQQPVIEVHLSNIFRAPESPRQSLTAWGFLAGLGPSVYELALRGLADRLDQL